MSGIDEAGAEDDYAETLRATALAALVKAGVLARCPDHTEILLRIGDADQERHAQALAPHLAADHAHLDRTDLQIALREAMADAKATCPLCEAGR